MINLINKIFSNLPLHLLEKSVDSNLILPFYHTISNNELIHIKHLFKYKNLTEFRKDIDFFLKRYKPISLSDLIESTKRNQPITNKSFLLTFDDGLSEIYDNIAPILKEKGIPAIFFVNSNFIDNKDLMFRFKASILIEKFLVINDSIKRENVIQQVKKILESENEFKLTSISKDFKKILLSIPYSKRNLLNKIAEYLDLDFTEYLKENKIYLSSEEIKNLIKDGFDIGAHSIDHPYYSSISFDEQIRQTSESINFLTKKFELTNRSFAFPFNDISVINRFFLEINKTNSLDISFGSSEMKCDLTKNNFQRVAVEETDLPIDTFFKHLYIKKYLRKLLIKIILKDNIMRIVEYTIDDLKELLTDEEFWKREVLPISKHRLISHINNPRALGTDLALIVSFNNKDDDNSIIGYLGMLPDKIFIKKDKEEKFAWMSCWWVDPKMNNRGIGSKLLQRAVNFYKDNIGGFHPSDMAIKALIENGKYSFIEEPQGIAVIFNSNTNYLLKEKFLS